MLRTGSVPGSPDPFDGDKGGRLVGSLVSVKAPATESSRKDGVQMAPAIGTSVKATNVGDDPLFRRIGLVSSDPISKPLVLGPLCGRICWLSTRVRLALKGDMCLILRTKLLQRKAPRWVHCFRPMSSTTKLSELRGGERTLDQWVSEARGSGSVMGLSAGKDAMFEEVQGKVAMFWVSLTLSTALVCFHRFLPHWVGFMGIP